MTDPHEWPFLSSFRATTAGLVAEGSPFEVVEELVRDEPMAVFKHRARSLGELLGNARVHGEKDFLVFDRGPRITFAEHDRMVASAAMALRDRYGVRPGDRVAIASANTPGWIVTAHACFILGAVVVALNSWWSADELTAAVREAEPVLIVADERRRRLLEGRTGGSPVLAVERVLEDLAGADVDRAAVRADVEENDPAVLLYTSGTSGRPKAAVLSHRSLIGFVQLTGLIGARAFVLSGGSTRPTDPIVRLAVFPLFHISGLASLLGALTSGDTTVWPEGRFDPDRVIALTRDERINFWSGASTHVIRLLESTVIDDIDGSSMLGVGIGGSASTPSLIARTETHFPHLRGTFSSGYGMTECGGLATYAPYEMLAVEPDCVGDPLPTVQVRVVDDEGATIPDGEVGTICIRSPIVMSSYWRNPEADARAFLDDGWLRTEDFGRLVDGVLFLNSRRRDLIIRGGENVYPTEIEDCLDQHPHVIESACIGRPHDELGQQVHAVVVVRPGSLTDPEELRAHCEARIATFKVPASIEITGRPLPRNAAGKVLKRELEAVLGHTDVRPASGDHVV